MLQRGDVRHTGDGNFLLGLVANQSFREGGEWGIWKVETGSIDCLLRTVRREGKDRHTGAVRSTWVGSQKGDSFLFDLVFLLPLFFFFKDEEDLACLHEEGKELVGSLKKGRESKTQQGPGGSRR